MTLKEKFQNIPSDYLPLSNNQKNECVEITDEFAIGFADWIRVCKLKERSYDFDNIEELLKTYKEEKGL